MRLEVVFDENGPDGFNEMRVEHINTGNINRNRNCEPDFLFPLPHLGSHIFPDIEVKFFDKAVVFEKRYELSGGDKAKIRMDPADKRFCTGENRLIGRDIKFRLIKYFELLFFNSLMEAFYKLLFEDFTFVRFENRESASSNNIMA